MTRAFIVRPFGEKKFGKEQIAVNFDHVEKTLIDPALTNLNIEGRTTAEILESGNIRGDMFQRLVVSDLVIADLTIHNANVFYELGIRHALRDKRTFLIYSRIGDETLPFDLQTDRYLAYDHERPAASLPALIAGLRQTLASDQKDSPIFMLLPALRAQDPGRFMVVPRDFREDVQQAEIRSAAGMLALMAAEVAGLVWEREGLRLVAHAQSRLNLPAAAKESWQRLLRLEESDAEANLELGAIHQTFGDLDQSNVSLKRVLDDTAADPRQRAEAHALRAQNAVEYWHRAVRQADRDSKQRIALLSPRLEESYNEFRRAFELDLRNYRLGIEALARLTVWTTLAQRLQGVWEDAHDSPADAAVHARTLKEDVTRLAAATDLSIQIARRQQAAETDINLRIGRAQMALLTSVKSEKVATAYLGAVEYASPADLGELRRFLGGFEDIEVLAANVAAASKVVESRYGVAAAGSAEPSRILLFRGYGPSLIAHEAAVKEWLRAKLEAEAIAVGAPALLAIAGGCCGGDIVFHELCQEMKIRSQMHLPFTADQFVPRFVQCADPGWIDRFRKLATTVPLSVMQPSADMPHWLKDRETYTFLERWNSWMLSVARSSAQEATLLGICDETRADDEGVGDLIKKARLTGTKPIVISPAALLGG